MFGETLKILMDEKNIGVAKFKRLTGISAGYMSDLQKGKYLPSTERLEIIIKTLNLDEDEENKLKEEWSFSKTSGILAHKYNTLKENNKNMKNVLKSVKKETELVEEIRALEVYKKIYDILFGHLSEDEAKELLKAISEKLEIFARRKNKFEQVSEKIERLNSIIESIE